MRASCMVCRSGHWTVLDQQYDVWRCTRCGNFVECMPLNAEVPLGPIWDDNTRNMHILAQQAIDRLIDMRSERSGLNRFSAARSAMKWLAKELGIADADCFIRYMPHDEAKRALEICRRFL